MPSPRYADRVTLLFSSADIIAAMLESITPALNATEDAPCRHAMSLLRH